MPSLPAICLQIVTWNNCDDLIATLKSLQQLDYPKEQLDLLVFDNGSTDGTMEKVATHMATMTEAGWGRADYHRSEDNLGAFGGRAAAQKLMTKRAEFFFSLDDDLELAADSLAILLTALQQTAAGSAGARIVYHSDPSRVAISAGYMNPWSGTFSGSAPTQRTPCHFTGAGATLFRRTVFDSVGGFDADFYTSHGDVDIGLKIVKSGHEVLYVPQAVIEHKVAIGGTRTPERMYYQLRNKVLLFRKHLSLPQRLTVYSLYALAWVPKLLLSSIAFHRGVNGPELKAIARAVADAVLDRRGQRRSR